MSRTKELYEKLKKKNGTGSGDTAPSSANTQSGGSSAGTSRTKQLYAKLQQQKSEREAESARISAEESLTAYKKAVQRYEVDSMLAKKKHQKKYNDAVEQYKSDIGYDTMSTSEKGNADLYLKYAKDYAGMSADEQSKEAARLYDQKDKYTKSDVVSTMKSMTGWDSTGTDINNDSKVNSRDVIAQLRSANGTATNDSEERYKWLLYYGDQDALSDERYKSDREYYTSKDLYEASKEKMAELEASGALERPEEQETSLVWRSGLENLLARMFGIGAYDEDDPEVAAYNKATEEYAAAEEEVNKYERLTSILNETKDYTKRRDFAANSTQGSVEAGDYIKSPEEKANEEIEKLGEVGVGADFSSDFGGNLDNSYQSNATIKRQYGADAWSGMTEQEKSVYYYIYRTEGEAAAKDYLDRIRIVTSKRNQDKIAAEAANGSFIDKVGFTLAGAAGSAYGAASSLTEDIISASEGNYNPYSSGVYKTAQTMKSGVQENMSGVGKFFYGAGTSAIESVVGAGTLGRAYTVIMGMGAASTRAKELWEDGASSSQVVVGAGLDGIAEALFEEASVEHLLSDKTLNGVWSWIKERVIKQGLVEASEEGLTGIANVINDIANRGSQSDTYKKYRYYLEENGGDEEDALKSTLWDTVKEVGLEAAAGAVSGAAMGATYHVGELVDVAKMRSTEKSVSNKEEAEKFIDAVESARSYRKMEGTLTAEDDARYQEAEQRVKDKYEVSDDVTITPQGEVTSEKAIRENLTKAVNNAQEAAYSREYLTTDTGETEYADGKGEPEAVTVEKVVDGENGKKAYLLTDGRTVSSETVTFGTKAEASVYGMLLSSAVDADSANTIAKSVLSETEDHSTALTAAQKTRDAISLYNEGNLGLSYAEAVRLTDAKNASTSLMSEAYELGRSAYNERVAAQQAAAQRGDVAYARKGRGNVIYEDSVTDAVKADLAAREDEDGVTPLADIEALGEVAKALGIDIHLYASAVGEDGKRTATVAGRTPGANGFYDHATGDIYIDVYSGRSGNSLMLFTAAHELTHFIKQNSPAGYKALSDYLMQVYGEKGQSVEELIDRQIEKADREGRTIDREEALEEVVADSMESMLADGEAIKQLAAEQPGVVRRIIEKLKEIIGRLTKRYDALDPDSKEGQLIKSWVDEAVKLREMFTAALKDAKGNYAKAGVGEATSTEISYANNYSTRETTQAERDAEDTAKELRDRFWLKMSKGDIAERLGTLYEQIETEMQKESPDMEMLDKAVSQVAAEIDSQRGLTAQRSEYADRALGEVRGTKIFLDEKQVAEVKHLYGSMKAFTQKFFGDRITFTSDSTKATSLDSLWQEWATQFPGVFDADTNSNDMPAALLEALDTMKNSTDESGAVDYKALDAELESAIWDGYRAFADLRTSNRAILTSALEETAQTPEEKTNLQRYRDSIDEINKAEMRLDEVNAEIKRLSFAEGKRDTARLDELKAEKARLQSQISKADSRLLKLEASTPLKNLVSRAKESTRAKMSAEMIEREAELRAQRDAEIKAGVKDARERYRERLKELRTRKGRAETKRKLDRLKTQLRQMALRPVEKSFAPPAMLRQVLDFLDLVDNWTPKRNKNGEIAQRQSKTQRDKAQTLHAEYTKARARLGLDAETNASKVKASQNEEGNSTAVDVDPVDMLLDYVEDIFAEGDKSINDLTDEELTKVYQAAQIITHQVKTAMRTISLKKAKSINKLKKNFATTVRASAQATNKFEKKLAQLKEKHDWMRIKETYDWARLRPKTVFEIMGNFTKNSAASQVYEMLNDAALDQGKILNELNEIFAHLMPGDGGGVDVKYKQFNRFIDPKEAVDVGLKDENGNTYTVTHDMLVMLALSLSHPDNFAYVVENGFSAPQKDKYYKGNTGEAYAKGSKRIYPPHAVESNRLFNERSELRDKLKVVDDEDERANIRNRIDEIDETLKTYREEQQAWGEELRKNVFDAMDEYDRDWFDSWRAFAEASQKYLNEATQKMYGFDRATVENYFPIRTDSRFGAASFESLVHDFTLEALGFMKARVGKGLNPLYLEGVSYVAQDHIKKVSQYAGLAPALRDVSKVLGKTVTMSENKALNIKEGEPLSVMAEIDKSFGKQGTKWIENLLADLNGARQRDGGFSRFVRKVRSHYAGAVLTLNPSVSLGQAASFATATAILGHKAVDRALALHGLPVAGKATPELIAKYTSILESRNVGVSERGASTQVGRQTVLEYAEQKYQFIFGWISAVDNYTVNRLWWASEYYVRDHSDLYDASKQTQSDEYYTEVARVFVKVIQETQPNYTVMQRPDLLRNPNELLRSLTMFMTQRLQNASMLYESRRKYARYAYDYKHNVGAGTESELTKEDVTEARNEFVRSTIGVVESSATLALLKWGGAALLYRLTSPWRDEDDELTAESQVKHLLDLFLSSLLSNYVGGSEAYSAAKRFIFGKEGGEDELLEVNTVERINKVYSDLVKLRDVVAKANEDGEFNKEEWKSIGLKFKAAAADFIETTLGLPVNNAGKIVDAILKWTADAVDGKIDFEQRVDRTKTQQGRRIVKAYLADNTNKVEAVEKEIGEANKSYDAYEAVRDYLNDAYKNNKVTREEATKILSGYMGKSDDDVYYWFKEHDAAKEGNDDYKKSDEWLEAVKTGENLDATAKDYLDHGLDKGDLGNYITTEYKDEYVGYVTSGDKTSADALKKKLLKGYVAAGYDKNEKSEAIDNWYRQEVNEAYNDGKIGKSEAVSDLQNVYGFSYNEAEDIVNGWKGADN